MPFRIGLLVATLASPLASQGLRVGVSADASRGRGTPVVGATDDVTLAGATLTLQGPIDVGVRGTGVVGAGRRGGVLGTAWLASTAARPVGASFTATRLAISNAPDATRADAGLDARWRGRSASLVARGFIGGLRREGSGGGDAGLDLAAGVLLGRHVRLGLTAQATRASRDGYALWFLRLSDDEGDVIRGTVARTFVDLAPTLRVALGPTVLDAALTTRLATGSPSRRLGAQATFEFPIVGAVRGTLGVGDQLPDVRLMLGRVRWASAGVRIAFASRPFGRPPAPRVDLDTPVVTLARGRIVVLAAPSVTRVAIRGDFTGFEPRPCTARGAGRFDCGESPAPGAHRVALRLDDGPWRAPGNLATVPDDFGGSDGDWLVPAER